MGIIGNINTHWNFEVVGSATLSTVTLSDGLAKPSALVSWHPAIHSLGMRHDALMGCRCCAIFNERRDTR